MKKIITLTSILALTACTSGYEQAHDDFTALFQDGQYDFAAQTMEKATISAEVPEDLYLGGLQCGTGYLWANNPQSDMCFSATSAVLSDPELETSGYKIKTYEKIMLPTYWAIANMTNGENPNVNFNRAYDMQKNSVNENDAEITKMQEEDMKKFAKDSKNVTGLADMQSIIRAVDAEMSNAPNAVHIPDAYKSMTDFVNPYTTYLSAIYKATNGNQSNMSVDFKRMKSFAPNNTFVKTDENAIKSGEKSVWIFFENGTIGDIKKRALAPEILQAANIKITIPDVFPGTKAASDLIINTTDGITRTEFLADMDSILKRDQDKYKTANIISSVTFEVAKVAAAATAKIAADHAAKKNDDNPWMKFAGDAALIGIMSAEKPWDLRHWDSLPTEVQVARVKMPQDRTIYLPAYDINVEIPAEYKNAFVFIRVPNATSFPGIIVGKIN